MIFLFLLFLELNFFNERINCLNLNYLINNCFFHSLLLLNENGAAINFNITSNNFLNINECIFNNCKCFNGSGGAIFFNNLQGNYTLNKFCGNNCSTNEFHQFGCFVISDNKIQNNILGSILKSSNNYLNKGSIFTTSNGFQNFKFLNLSNNIVYKYSFTFYGENNLIDFSYCTFINNTVSDIIIIIIGGTSIKKFFYCNLINNSQFNSVIQNYGVFSQSNWAKTEIIYCFFENNAKLGNKKLFAIDSGTIKIENTFIDLISLTHNIIPSIINPISSSNLLIHSEICTFLCYYKSNCFITENKIKNFKINVLINSIILKI